MKNITKKILKGILPLLIIISFFLVFSTDAAADEGYRIERVCGNGICVVTVYSADGSIVNVYEELDSNP